LLAALDDESTRSTVTAERAFLSGLGGGCAVPVAAYAETAVQSHESGLKLTGLVISANGRKAIRVTGEGTDAFQVGNELARKAITQGADEILALNGVK
jgi:hydroxymethylbilane synthase